MLIVGPNPEGVGYIVGMSTKEIADLCGVDSLSQGSIAPGCFLDVAVKIRTLRAELSRAISITTPPDPVVRIDAYKNVLKRLEGNLVSARDNTLSAHAVVLDIMRWLETEIDLEVNQKGEPQ